MDNIIPLWRFVVPNKIFIQESDCLLVMQVVSEPSLTKSGVYWSWNKNSASFENQLSQEASDAEKARRVWELSEKLVGLA